MTHVPLYRNLRRFISSDAFCGRRLQLPVRFLAFVVVTAGCTSKASCPPHRRMVDGSSCTGETLQCEYEVPVFKCDGTTDLEQSSCTCVKGKWDCPAPVVATCASTTSPINGGGGAGATSSAQVSSGGAAMYENATASGTAKRVPPSGKNASCPLIYIWDGERFKYVTDVGGLTIGLPQGVTANQAIPVPNGGTFYHLVPGAKHDPKTGMAMLLRESVSEIAYIDEVGLLLIDHPDGTEVWSSGDESTNEWGYVRPFKMYTTTAPRSPIAATDREGVDVLDALSRVDNVPARVSADSFDNEYLLDFGAISAPEHARLVIDGWSIYRYRAKADVEPAVEAELADGTFERVANFGAPYGDFKTIVVDLSAKLPEGARRLRLTLGQEAGARWVIDRIRLDDSPPAEVRITQVETAKAELLHRGRATINRPTLLTRQDALDDEGPDDPAQLGFGAFTRYGDVRDLLTATDDRYVIMRHGDQLTLNFGEAPPPPSGWTRSVVLKIDDVMKSFFFERNVEPLPFHGMTAYPYSAKQSYPTDNDHRKYRNEYNTRIFATPETN